MEEKYTRISDYTLPFYCDSVESIEIESNFAECGALLSVGLYRLDEKAGHRNGAVCLYKIDSSCKTFPHSTPYLLTEGTGVLDSVWFENNNGCNIALATACANGRVSLLHLSSDFTSIRNANDVFVENNILLSIDKMNTSPLTICVSSASGKVFVISPTPSDEFVVQHTIKAHDYECWIAAASPFNDTTLFTGADDSLLKMWDLRSDKSSSVVKIKWHSSGVCSIRHHPLFENYMVSGRLPLAKLAQIAFSYDETICLWDIRCFKTPVSTVSTGGGVWRLRWTPDGSKLAAAAMHGGCSILTLGDNHCLYPVAASAYFGHSSIVYGVTWIQSDQVEGLLATCSFYDSALHFWKCSYA